MLKISKTSHKMLHVDALHYRTYFESVKIIFFEDLFHLLELITFSGVRFSFKIAKYK